MFLPLKIWAVSIFHTLLLNCHVENKFTRVIIQPLQFTHRSNFNDMCVNDVLANSMRPFDIKHTENALPIQYYYIILSRQHHIIRHQITIAGACAVFNHQVVVRPARGFFVNYSYTHLLRTAGREIFSENLMSVPRFEYVHSIYNMIFSPRGDRSPRLQTRFEVGKPTIA